MRQSNDQRVINPRWRMSPGLPMFYYDIAVLLRFGSSENQNYKTDIPDVCETEENSSANTVVGPYTQPHTHT